MKFVICWPRPVDEDLKSWGEQIQNDRLKADGVKYFGEREKEALYNFYTNLITVLEEKGLEYEILDRVRYRIPPHSPRDIAIAYHTTKPVDMVDPKEWIVHTSGSAGYFTCDQVGYAGFSLYARHKPVWDPLHDVDLDVARPWFKQFAKDYIESGESRQVQHDKPFELDEPYLFIPGQLSYDSVMQLAKIPANTFYKAMSEQAHKHGLKVVYKPHPAELVKGARPNTLRAPEGAIISNASIHKLIAGAEAVATVNSGVGFEALLHEKPVYISGLADYQHACHKCFERGRVGQIDFTWRPDLDILHKMVYDMHHRFYVDCYDLESMRRKVDHILSVQQ